MRGVEGPSFANAGEDDAGSRHSGERPRVNSIRGEKVVAVSRLAGFG